MEKKYNLITEVTNNLQGEERTLLDDYGVEGFFNPFSSSNLELLEMNEDTSTLDILKYFIRNRKQFERFQTNVNEMTYIFERVKFNQIESEEITVPKGMVNKLNDNVKHIKEINSIIKKVMIEKFEDYEIFVSTLQKDSRSQDLNTNIDKLKKFDIHKELREIEKIFDTIYNRNRKSNQSIKRLAVDFSNLEDTIEILSRMTNMNFYVTNNLLDVTGVNKSLMSKSSTIKIVEHISGLKIKPEICEENQYLCKTLEAYLKDFKTLRYFQAKAHGSLLQTIQIINMILFTAKVEGDRVYDEKAAKEAGERLQRDLTAKANKKALRTLAGGVTIGVTNTKLKYVKNKVGSESFEHIISSVGKLVTSPFSFLKDNKFIQATFSGVTSPNTSKEKAVLRKQTSDLPKIFRKIEFVNVNERITPVPVGLYCNLETAVDILVVNINRVKPELFKQLVDFELMLSQLITDKSYQISFERMPNNFKELPGLNREMIDQMRMIINPSLQKDVLKVNELIPNLYSLTDILERLNKLNSTFTIKDLQKVEVMVNKASESADILVESLDEDSKITVKGKKKLQIIIGDMANYVSISTSLFYLLRQITQTANNIVETIKK